MAYDETLVKRIRGVLFRAPGLSEQQMFGGICFFIAGHVACGVQKEELVVRVGPENYRRALLRKHTRPMECAGEIMTEYVYVSNAGYKREVDLENWLLDGIEYVRTLPPIRSEAKTTGHVND